MKPKIWTPEITYKELDICFISNNETLRLFFFFFFLRILKNDTGKVVIGSKTQTFVIY